MAHKGYFVIADITGYTAFLTGSELEHAQDILKTLFDTLLDNIKPPLLLSNFQGDAILTYAPEGSFHQGQTLLEIVESIYGAFAHKIELMHHNTTCTCKACSNIPKLDLKVFVHYGEFVFQDMRGKAELSGPDVIIAHRMMKNDVKEKTGLHAYALFSKAAIDALGLQDFTCEMKPHSETYEHIGEVPMYAYCLKTMWEREREKRRVFIKSDEAWMTVERDIPFPPAAVWDLFNTPDKRREMLAVEGVSITGKNNGRTSMGSTVHCYHGTAAPTDFIIVDWKPFEYMTEDVSGIPMKLSARCTTRFTPTEDGTLLAVYFTRPLSNHPVYKIVSRVMSPIMKKELTKDYIKVFTNAQRILEQASVAAQTGAESAAQ